MKVGDKVRRLKTWQNVYWHYGNEVCEVEAVLDDGETIHIGGDGYNTVRFELVESAPPSIDEEIRAMEAKLDELKDKRDMDVFKAELAKALKEFVAFDPKKGTAIGISTGTYFFQLTCSKA